MRAHPEEETMYGLAISLCALGLLSTSTAPTENLILYDDAGAAYLHRGSRSIALAGEHGNSASFSHSSAALNTQQYPTLHFWIRGGAAGGQHVRLRVMLGDVRVAQAALERYVGGGDIAKGDWREVTVRLTEPPLSYSGWFDRIDLESDDAGRQPSLSISDVGLIRAVPLAVSTMQIERDVTVASILSDRFTWQDSTNQPRVAVLAHNDGPAGPNGSYGGALREFRYKLNDGTTRIAGVTTDAGYAANLGFGYVVAHQNNSVRVGDDSPLGGRFAGQFQRVFEGRHHAIFRFKQNYPRNCSLTNAQARTLPVTIDWIFATGRDNPVYAITYDVDLAGPQAPMNTFNDDARAPYGELNIDGDGATAVSGVAWGDRYKFTSTTVPVTLDSAWTWNVSNTVPYVKLWLAGPLTVNKTGDATMGIVQTQTMTQQDAAGGRDPFYHDCRPLWNNTSATAPNPDARPYAMPWQNEWPYQANANSIGVGISSNNTRLTWRTQFGFLGQQTYDVNDNVVATAPGYPKKSYSTYIVLGQHTASPVEAQLTQVETVQSLTLTTTTGSFVTSARPALLAPTL